MWHRTALVILVVLSASGAVVQPAAADTAEWKTYETENFVVEYQEGYRADAEKIGRLTETARSQLLAAMPAEADVSLEEKIRVRVYPDSQWGSDSRLYWSDSTPVRIHLQAPSESPTDTDWYQHGIAHEYANIVLWDEATDESDAGYYGRNPSWFNEGLSEYYAYRTDAVADQFPPYDVRELNRSIEQGNGYFAQVATNRYHGGQLLAMYMVDVYGERGIWSLLRSDQKGFAAAVEANLGVTYLEFQAGWRKWAEENVGGDYPEATLPEADTRELRSKLGTLEALLDRRNRTLETVRSLLYERNQTLADLRTRLDELNRTVESLRDTLDAREATIARLRNASSDVTINVTVRPANGERFVEGGTAIVTASGDRPRRDLRVTAGGETYAPNGTGVIAVPLTGAGTRTLTLRYANTSKPVRLDVRASDRQTDDATETSNGGGTGFGLAVGGLAVALVGGLARRIR